MSLFSSIKAGKFGKFGNRFDNFTDEMLMSAYKNGDADALAEFANRHPNLIASRFWKSARALNNDIDDNAGEIWLAMDRAAKQFDASKGAAPTSYMVTKTDGNLGERISKKQLEGERYSNYDDIPMENGDSGADALGASIDATAREQDLNDMKDMLAKLEKQLEGMTLGKKEGTTGKDMLDQYKLAEWDNAKKGVDARTEALNKFDNGELKGDESSVYMASAPITDTQVANGMGLKADTFKAQKQSMLDRLPTKLREEILASLRGRARK